MTEFYHGIFTEIFGDTAAECKHRQMIEKLCHNQFSRIHGRSEIENGPFCAILKSVTPTRANFDFFFSRLL